MLPYKKHENYEVLPKDSIRKRLASASETKKQRLS